MNDDGVVYGFVWVLIAYFCSFVFIVTGHHYGVQVWVYYGLFCFLVGLLFNISSKLNFLIDILSGAEVKYEWLGEED